MVVADSKCGGRESPHLRLKGELEVELGVPIYWNIAPEYDATITPRFIAARGNMVMTEGRYLLPNGAGIVNVDYLPNDKLFNDTRLHTSLNHGMGFGRWGVGVVHNYASDPFFFNDFSTNQLAASQTHLERRADVTYSGNHWAFLARAQNYQTLVGTEPYSRMPQLLLTADNPRRPNRPYASLESELVYFAHTNTSVIQGIEC